MSPEEIARKLVANWEHLLRIPHGLCGFTFMQRYEALQDLIAQALQSERERSMKLCEALEYYADPLNKSNCANDYELVARQALQEYRGSEDE